MLISSSRSPSQQTRSVCKWMASFFGCKYLSRGKRSLDELLLLADDEPLMVIGEYHGNPSSLLIYNAENAEKLSVWITVSPPTCQLPRRFPKPLVSGTCHLSDAFSSLLSLPKKDLQESNCLYVTEDAIAFINKGRTLFKFYIKSFREYGEGL